MEQRLSIVTLGVSDVALSRQFYERLGWSASSTSNDNIVFFQLGGIAFALYGRAALAEDANLPAPGDCFGGATLAYNVRQKSDVDRVLAEARAAGARILKPAQDAFWGGYSSYFADPDGHAWEIAWNPYFTILKDGSLRLPE